LYVNFNWEGSVIAERNNSTAKPAPRRWQAHFTRRLFSIPLIVDRRTDSGSKVVATMQTAEPFTFDSRSVFWRATTQAAFLKWGDIRDSRLRLGGLGSLSGNIGPGAPATAALLAIMATCIL
jgi:hypothetical protein